MSTKRGIVLMQKYKITKELGSILGATTSSRQDALKGVWAYIKNKGLQNPAAKREIISDPALTAVFGQQKLTMFQVMKLMNKNFIEKA